MAFLFYEMDYGQRVSVYIKWHRKNLGDVVATSKTKKTGKKTMSQKHPWPNGHPMLELKGMGPNS